MNLLLNALGADVKPVGKDRWVARCPVHQDKDFAMSIKPADTGGVMAYCHACGANGLELYNALGLDLDELFGGRKLERSDTPYCPQNIKDEYDVDKIVILISENSIAKNLPMTWADKKRHRLAVARSEGVKTKYKLKG